MSGLAPGILGADGPVPRRDNKPGSLAEGGPLRVPESGLGSEIEGGAENLPGSGRALILPLRLETLGPDGGRTAGASGSEGLDELPRLERVPRSGAEAAMGPLRPGDNVKPGDGRDGEICVGRGIEGRTVEPENEPLLLRLPETEGTLLCGNDGADTAGELREGENEPTEPDEPIRGCAKDKLGAEGIETDGAGDDGRDNVAPDDPPDLMLPPVELPRLELDPRESAHAENIIADSKTVVAMI
ncbi:MAG: hypothetical protein N3D11_09180 [Candidatus Sumerlaeia bacterium]|nr:hypothetical protein [Candidatus Sumerlaeia bacterium]